MFVYKKEHIAAHLFTVYVALTLLMYIKQKYVKELTNQQLLDAVAGSLGGVSGTLDGYAGAMTTVQPTLDAGITLTGTVEKYLTDIEDDVRRITGSDAFRRFTELMESSDADSMADYLTSPVQMNTEIIYEIKDYGAAMSPYYVMLALFVGSLLTAVMLKVPVTQPEFAGCRAVQRYFGRFITFFLMAMAQALVTAFGCLYFVGMEPAEPALFVLACCLCSLNFACMNYALVYALDNVGMALSVIIMVIQVAGSGGSYPIHVLPQIFQTLYPFMPFHYGMDMIRETVGGMYGWRAFKDYGGGMVLDWGVHLFDQLLWMYPDKKIVDVKAELMALLEANRMELPFCLQGWHKN